MQLALLTAALSTSPPPPVPRPPIVDRAISWLLSNEGESCTARCARSASSCDLATLLEVDTASEIKDAAMAAGEDCPGGDVGWSYASNPGICTHGGCCGDEDRDGRGDCEGICAFGGYGVTRTCAATSAHYSRICPCATVLSPSVPPPPIAPWMASPPPPVPRPPLAAGDWILAAEGSSCTQECAVSGGVCDEARLMEVTSEATIRAAAAAAGVDCRGGAIGWAYSSNPAICTHGRCCGDQDGDGRGDCEGICAFGAHRQRGCGVVNADYSRLCACNPVAPRPPPPPPLPPGGAACVASSQCDWPQSYCQCDEPYSEGAGGSVRRCRSGRCVLARDYQFSLVQRGGGCTSGQRIWWRHHYASSGASDTTLNSDADTGNPQVAAALAAAEPRCGASGGGLLQWSPAYSWEWGFFCCQPGAATTADNPNWNVLAFAPIGSPSPPQAAAAPSPPPSVAPSPPPLPPVPDFFPLDRSPPPPPLPPPLPRPAVRAPPATPPPPPVIVRATFVLAAEVSTFDVEAFRADLLRRVPGARSVTLAIAPASVVVEALFLMRSHLEAAAAIEVISGASAEEMSEAWFGGRVAVEAAPTVVEEAYSPASIGPLATEGSAAQRAAKGDGSQGRVDATSFALGAAAIAAIAAFVLALVRWRAIATRRPPGGCVSVGSSMTVGAEYSLSDPLPTATVGWGWNWHIGTTNSGKQQASPRTVWRKATASPVMARVGAASSSASPAACAPMAEDGATLPPYCFPCVSPEISSSTAPTIMGPADAVGQQNAL